MSGSAQLYVDYLTKEGFRPEIDQDGDVTFRYEGGFYYIDIDEEDPSYFRLVFPSFWKIESSEELGQALIAANHATMMIKVAKIYLNSQGDNVTASIEVFLAKPEDFESIFKRSLGALSAGVSFFVEKMKELSD